MELPPGVAPVKKEFLKVDYKPTLDLDYVAKDVKEKLEPATTSGSNETSSEPLAKKARLKGQNKNRAKFHDKRVALGDRLCSAILQGTNDCNYGSSCKFGHNIGEFLEKKLPDIGPKCYVFEQFGYCQYSFACRYGSSHIVKNSDGTYVNMRTSGESGSGDQRTAQRSNTLPRDAMVALRKKTYSFTLANKAHAEVTKQLKGSRTQPSDSLTVLPAANNGPTSEGAVSPPENVVDGLDMNIQMKPSDKESLSALSTPADPGTTGGIASTAAASGPTAMTEVLPESNENGSVVVPADSTLPDVLVQTLDQPDTSASAVTGVDAASIQPPTSDVAESKSVGPILSKTKVFDMNGKLYLAPLTTVGNLPFRRVCKGLGADVTCGEMALTSSLLQGSQAEWALLRRHSSEDLFGVQLCGAYADSLARCCQLVEEHCDVDFVDLNVGCPIDLVYKKGAGAGLMGRMSRFEEIVRTMSSFLSVPLTVKIRTGLEGKKNTANKMVPKLVEWGASMITLHGRTREQRYTKQANWEYINECSKLADPIPMFGNGDVLTYEDYNRNMSETGVSGCMIARGALIKPWIFTEIKEQRHWDISAGERLDLLKDFTNYGLEHWGCDTQGVESTRRFLLEWLSFLCRYIPVGLLERVPQKINERPPYYFGRSDLETLLSSSSCGDWVKISEMLLGPVPDGFVFLPKHIASAYK